ncbi:hypothetical protein [Lederbergia citrea]|uniref:hypothetical protein n=1 Tax=Lederbergia citrea TaxID=2833581 RepID=UPI001BC96CCA|nr:hypothetical protein [Lederbergia citrea]MBS4203759.1 hypothetical protein [Lederbergia citrea]
MTGTLIFLLFMFNILLTLAVVLLYLRQNRFVEIEKKQRKMQAESEELLTGFLMEIKEENEQFISKVSKMKEEEDLFQQELNTAQQSIKDVKHESHISAEAYARLLAARVYQTDEVDSRSDLQQSMNDPADAEEEALDEKSFSEQVNYLTKQGLSEEEIAKVLKKGKKEVELLLKFRGEGN